MAPVVWTADNDRESGYAIKEEDGTIRPTSLYDVCGRTDYGVRVDVEEIEPAKQQIHCEPGSKRYCRSGKYQRKFTSIATSDIRRKYRLHFERHDEYSFDTMGRWAFPRLLVQSEHPSDDFVEFDCTPIQSH